MVLRVVTILLALGLAFLLTFLILSVVRLDGAGFRVAIVFIPVFIIMGCLQCCCMICGPCLCCCRPGGDEENPPDVNQGGSYQNPENEAPWNSTTVPQIVVDNSIPQGDSPNTPPKSSPPKQRPTEASPLRDID